MIELKDEARSYAIDALIGMEAKDQTPLILRAAVTDPDPNVRLECANFIMMYCEANDAAAMKTVLTQLEDKDEVVMSKSLQILKKWKKIEEVLLAAKPSVALRVINDYRETGLAENDPETQQVLKKLTQHKDPAVASAAQKALEK